MNAYGQLNVPVDLVSHVDAFLSPNLWLRALIQETGYTIAEARGELTSLGSLHSTLRFYTNVLNKLRERDLVKAPKFSESLLPPTVLRAPVSKSDERLDLLHVLKLLADPLKPMPLGSNLRLKPSS